MKVEMNLKVCWLFVGFCHCRVNVGKRDKDPYPETTVGRVEEQESTEEDSSEDKVAAEGVGGGGYDNMSVS